jgi:hypothetical protein
VRGGLERGDGNRPRDASGFLRVVVAHGHGIRKNGGIWNNDLPSFFRLQDRRTGLYIGNIPFNSRNADEITQCERLLQQQENAREEILKNILKCKPCRVWDFG